MSEEEVKEVVEEEDQQPSEAEQKAMANGWSPKEEWRGDPNQWVDAETFNQRGEEINKVLKERNDRLYRELSELKDTTKQMHQFFTAAQKKTEKEYQEKIRQYQRQMDKAAEDMDPDTYREARQNLSEAISERRAEVEEAQKEQLQQYDPSKDVDYQEWLKDNQWFAKDEDLRAYAGAISDQIMQRTGLQGRALYDAVTARVKEVFPNKFTNPRRNEPSAVGGATPRPAKAGKKTFDDLPSEAKKAYARFKKQLGDGYTKEEYLKHYVWE